MEFKGSQTERNLQAAFSGESIARNKYIFYAERARQEHQPEIAELFEQMAQNEGVHGRLFYQRFHGIGSTAANLQDAISGEYGEWTSMYPGFAQTAREEGFEDVAALFDSVARIERDHEFRFMSALAQLHGARPAQAREEDQAAPVPEAPRTVTAHGYRCTFCGAVFDQRPDVCGVCEAIGSFEPTVYQKKL